MSDLRSYHFDVGDSTDGPVGFCARITAHSAQEATRILKDVLPTEWPFIENEGPIEYVSIYFNPDYMFIKDIDESEPHDEGS